jgi:hypothetical protein
MNPTNDVFLVNESKDDPDSVAYSNDWIYIQHDDKEPSVIRYDLFVKQIVPLYDKKEMISTALENIMSESMNYTLEFSKQEMVQKLGTIRFYLRALQNIYDISDQRILQANADSLSDKYKELTKE